MADAVLRDRALSNYGDTTIDLLHTVYERGATRAVALMRHSAREYAPDKHDLENPLTEDGRSYARELGRRLPKSATVRAYASPPRRCIETAELILASHAAAGGEITRHRPLEALGVFYALDQQKMWKGMREAGGLVPYLESWFAGDVPHDAMMEPDLAAAQILRVMRAKLADPVADVQLDVCVSHDMTLHLLGARLLGEALTTAPVEYLDALVLYALDDELIMTNHRGCEVRIDAR